MNDQKLRCDVITASVPNGTGAVPRPALCWADDPDRRHDSTAGCQKPAHGTHGLCGLHAQEILGKPTAGPVTPLAGP